MTYTDKKSILVVSPHPDDETLGAGGTILKRKKLGDDIFWLNITEVSKEYGWEPGFVKKREEQIKKIKEFYDFSKMFDFCYKPAGLHEVDESSLISEIAAVYEEVKPDWIILPGPYDAHSDHRVTFDCCMAAAKPFRAPYIKRITTMEILSETDQGFRMEKFSPNLYVDITGEIEEKIRAMQIYDTETAPSPFPRNSDNIRSMARTRGAACYSDYAECFQLIRMME